MIFLNAECKLTLVPQVIPSIIKGLLYAPAAKILLKGVVGIGSVVTYFVKCKIL